jgi:hemolysin activation/secretion protein
LAALALALLVDAARAQPAVPPPLDLHFDIERYAVEGGTVLPPADIDRVVRPFTGKKRDFGDIQRASEALERAYQEHGYGIVRVILPEQNLAGGAVRLIVVEPRVAHIVVEDNKFFDADNIRRSVPAIRLGATPNTNAVARNLQIAAEHPVKQTTVLLRAGAAEDEVEAVLKVADDKPWRAFATLDNTGTAETGYWRSGVGYQHTNLFNRDHTLTAQYITSPTKPSRVSIYGAGYRIPFYEWNSSLELVGGYSDVNAGTVQGLFNVAGSGTIAGARWNYYLPKWQGLEHKASLGVDYRAFSNKVLFEGQSGLFPDQDITIHPVSLGYAALRRFATAELSVYGTASTNLPGGNDGRLPDFQRARAAATDRYRILRYGLGYNGVLPDGWLSRVVLNAQYTGDSLVPGEQFGLGGPDSVRGYLLRETVNDRGYQGQLEIYTPDVAAKLGQWDSARLRLLAFYDFGKVRRNGALPGEASEGSISSIGIGARLGYAKSASLRVDLAHLLRTTPNRASGGNRVTAGLVISF